MANVKTLLSGVTYEERLTPNREIAALPNPKGIIIHSTRSGIPQFTLDKELQATVNWFLRVDIPEAQRVSAHFVIGHGRIVRLANDNDKTWHAGRHNATHFGIEVCQPTSGAVFTDLEYEATAHVCRLLCEAYGIAPVHTKDYTLSGIIGHDETPQGQSLGKTDPGIHWDWDLFIKLVKQHRSVRSRILDHLDMIWAYNNRMASEVALLDNVEQPFYTNVEEATRIINERTIAIKEIVEREVN